MDELEAKLASLKSRGEAAATKHARAIAEQEAAKARVTASVKRLKDEFGVASVDEAKTLLASLTQEASEKLQEADRLLQEAESA